MLEPTLIFERSALSTAPYHILECYPIVTAPITDEELVINVESVNEGIFIYIFT